MLLIFWCRYNALLCLLSHHVLRHILFHFSPSSNESINQSINRNTYLCSLLYDMTTDVIRYWPWVLDWLTDWLVSSWPLMTEVISFQLQHIMTSLSVISEHVYCRHLDILVAFLLVQVPSLVYETLMYHRFLTIAICYTAYSSVARNFVK